MAGERVLLCDWVTSFYSFSKWLLMRVHSCKRPGELYIVVTTTFKFLRWSQTRAFTVPIISGLFTGYQQTSTASFDKSGNVMPAEIAEDTCHLHASPLYFPKQKHHVGHGPKSRQKPHFPVSWSSPFSHKKGQQGCHPKHKVGKSPRPW